MPVIWLTIYDTGQFTARGCARYVDVRFVLMAKLYIFVTGMKDSPFQ